jgi:hypothetical protein
MDSSNIVLNQLLTTNNSCYPTDTQIMQYIESSTIELNCVISLTYQLSHVAKQMRLKKYKDCVELQTEFDCIYSIIKAVRNDEISQDWQTANTRRK